MTKQEVYELLLKVRAAYSRFAIHDETAPVWYEYLKDENAAKVSKRFDTYVRSGNRKEPVIADFLPSREEKERESREYEIQLNRWVNAGHDPAQFSFKP